MSVHNPLKDDQDVGSNLKTYCQVCQNTQKTNHEVLKSVTEEYSEGEYYFSFGTYQIIKCKGCETLSFRHASGSSEDIDYFEDGSYKKIVKERLYPKRSANTSEAKPFQNTPQKLRRIYQETIETYNAESFTLCAAGLRAIVEGICADQGVIGRSLADKIEGLFKKGLLTKTSADILHEHRFLGNSAIHELERPTAQDLKLAIEIIEHTLEALFEMPHKGETLRQRRNGIQIAPIF